MKIKGYLTWNTIEVDKCTSFRHSLSFPASGIEVFLWVHVLCLVLPSPSIPTFSEASLNRLLHTSPIPLSLIHSCGLCPNQLRHSSPGALLSLYLFGYNQILVFWLLQPNWRRHKWSHLRYSSTGLFLRHAG